MTPPSEYVLMRTFSLVIAGLAASVLIWMLHSPVFDVRNVSVHRADSSPPPAVDLEDIDAAAQRLVGHNVFQIDTNRMREELRELPGVADALVQVRLDGRAVVTVAYEAPVANWVVDGKSFLVNASGEVLAPHFEPDLQLTVEDTSHDRVVVGDLIDVGALFAAHQLQSNLPLLRVIPSRIRYTSSGLTVVDHAGRELEFGDTAQLSAKLTALHAVLEQANRLGERIASVDLRPVERPTYRTVGAPPLITNIDVTQAAADAAAEAEAAAEADEALTGEAP